MHLVADLNLWEEVGKEMGKDTRDVKIGLNLIIDRRNCIAHEADIDPSYPDSRWPINESMVDESIDFIEKIAESIYAICRR